MVYHEKERRNKENANVVHIVYLLAKLRNVFDEVFSIDVSIYIRSKAAQPATSNDIQT